MKPKIHKSILFSSIVLAITAGPCALAQNLSWDANGSIAGAGDTPTGTWGVDPFWNTTGNGDVTEPTNAVTTLSHDLFFSAGTDAINAYTVTVTGMQYARSISFQEGTPTLSGGSIVLSSGGSITVNSSANLAGAAVTSDVTISGRTSFAIGSTGGARTLALSSGTFTREPGAVLLVTSGGNLTSTMTGLSANTHGIVGPWATFGTAGTTQYATFNGSSIVGLAAGTAAGTAANVTDTTGTINYDVAAGGTLGANASANTLRYTGAAGTINTSGTFKVNGILNPSANALNIAGAVTIGATSELVINNPNAGGVGITGAIGDHGGSPSGLIKTGSGTLTLGGSSTYSGSTTIVGSSGGIVVTANNALGTAAGGTTVLPFQTGGNSLGFSGGIHYSTAEPVTGSGPGSNTAVAGSFAAVQRGFVQSVSGNNTFAGAIQISAGGNSRIGVQDGAQLKLTGPITMAAGTTGVTVVFRAGATNGDFITLTNRGNSWDTETLIFSSNTGTGAGVRLGADNALPTSIPVGALSTASTGTTLDLAGYNQEVNGLSITTGGTNLKITNSAPATTSVLTLNTTFNRSFNPGGLIQDGAGAIQLVKKGAANQSLQAAHTYTGGTLIKEGSITIGGGNDRLPVAGTVTLGDTGTTGKLVLGSAGGFPRNQKLAGLTTSGNGGSVVGADAAVDSVLTLDIATSNTFGGTLGGPGTNENKLTLVKEGAGVLTLAGANTYSGNTTVNNGTLVLADDARLTFVLGSSSGVTNTIAGTGNATLNGDFIIDTTAADALETGTWTLEDLPTLAGPYATTFSVVGFTDAGGDKWTKPNGPAKQYTFDETTGVLTLGPSSGNFAAWANDPLKGNIPGEPASGDFDHDGISNLVEYALGKNPRVSNPQAGVLSGNTITFTKGADALANNDVSWTIETSATLAAGSWLPEVSHSSTNDEPSISHLLTPGAPARKFVRLKVVQVP
jgi:autotransporter-associated beta strand protein